MKADAQHNFSKRSSRLTREFLRRLSRHAPLLLREVANLRNDGVDRLRQRYAPFFDRYEEPELFRLRDELRALWTGGREMAMPVRVDWQSARMRLWANKKRAPQEFGSITLQEFICSRWLYRARGGLAVFWEGRRREILPDPYELPALLAYTSLLCGDRLRVCRSRDCPARYFVARRRDQRYCSAECAAPAKRAAKLRSWHEHKGEWPSQRRRAKSSRRKNR